MSIIIIGAGAAGLAAAGALIETGRKVIVLEARDRIGGRVHTVRDPRSPLPVELGADFIHGRSPEIWDICDAVPVAAYDVKGDHWLARGGRLSRSTGFWSEIGAIMEKMERDEGPDRTFREFIEGCCAGDEMKEAVRRACAYVEGFHAGPVDRIGIKGLARAEAGEENSAAEKSFRIADGYDRVIEWLHGRLGADRGILHLNTVVESIEWSRGKVRVHAVTATGGALEPFEGEGAVITVPLAVLQAAPGERGAIRFIPDITEKRGAINGLAMGSVVKIILRFRERFWESLRSSDAADDGATLDEMLFLHADGEPVPTWWSWLPVRASVLTGWAGGPAAERLLQKGPQGVLDTALEALARSLGVARSTCEEQLEAWHLHDWSADPFTRGAYTFLPVGGIEAQQQLARPIDDTLYFAGEATDPDGIGTVHGAIASGKRVGREIGKCKV